MDAWIQSGRTRRGLHPSTPRHWPKPLCPTSIKMNSIRGAIRILRTQTSSPATAPAWFGNGLGSKNCHVTQREVFTHTESFATALRASLREDPDVIMVGEMRDLETISLAITASETGHLVLA